MVRLTRKQVREVDRLAVERYGMPSIVLMENAARAVAEEAWMMLQQRAGRSVLILCGGGNNGGDGLAAARHLHNRGVDVQIALTTDPDGYKGDALTNYNIIRKMGLPCEAAAADRLHRKAYDLVIDAIFGTGLTQCPRPPFEQLAAAVNSMEVDVLAVDIPSGLDCDTGKPLGPCIRARQTVTFVATKVGFAAPEASEFTGDVTIADIGCPRELIDQVAQIE